MILATSLLLQKVPQPVGWRGVLDPEGRSFLMFLHASIPSSPLLVDLISLSPHLKPVFAFFSSDQERTETRLYALENLIAQEPVLLAPYHT